MVKLEKPAALPPSSSLPMAPTTSTAGFAFRSIVSKPPMAPSSALSSLSSASNGLTGFIPKRQREEDGDARAAADEDNGDEDDEMSPKGSKRSCLPKKCDFPMCKNSSRSRGFCYSHGGGRRCRVDGCSNGAVSRDLCKRHGGGRRCRIAGCKSSSESGGLCYSHGGGRRCSLSWCNARAKKGGYCATHIDNRDAAPPSSDTDNDELKAQVVSGDEDTRASTAEPSVHPQVIETLLSLSKSSSGSESGEDGASMMSPTSPAGVATTSRQVNPYAIASILN
ncbi:hypothetical protein PINS_up004670 [Pythium insidiosum]|nr:hypothetical protein PINS_up004670 [Pythium insidiosum]